jgi:2-oxoglutarate ferredoxin oxidoreductase subunit alpha
MRERLDIPQAGDLHIVNRRYTSKTPEDYLPFASAALGCPDAAPLGEGYHTIYSLNPHSEGGSIDWDPDVFDRLYKRITGKIRDNRKKICRTEKFLYDDAECILISYGSEVRSVLGAAYLLRDNGVKAGVLKLCNVWPVPEEEIVEAAKGVKKIFSVEMNMGKYLKEIQRLAGAFCPVVPLTKNRGLVHTSDEVYRAVKENMLN